MRRRKTWAENADNRTLALMVYETWLLNGATQEALPSPKLRKWCDRQLSRCLVWTPARDK